MTSLGLLLEGIVNKLLFDHNYPIDKKEDINKKTNKFTSDFFDYLHNIYPIGLKPCRFDSKQIRAIGIFLDFVEEETLYPAGNGGTYYLGKPIFASVYNGQKIEMGPPAAKIINGQYFLIAPVIEDLKVNFSSLFDPELDFPFENYINTITKNEPPVHGIHFRFLPKKAQTPEDVAKYWIDLTKKRNSAAIYSEGNRIDLSEVIQNSPFSAKEERTRFYYVGCFESKGLGKEVHVYGHNCQSSNTYSDVKEPSPFALFHPVHSTKTQ
jgi:hypothetical protein